jgi:hypothetical protein
MKVVFCLTLVLLFVAVITSNNDMPSSRRKNAVTTWSHKFSKKVTGLSKSLFHAGTALARRLSAVSKYAETSSTSNSVEEKSEDEIDNEVEAETLDCLQVNLFFNLFIRSMILPCIVHICFLSKRSTVIPDVDFFIFAYVIPVIFKLFYGFLNAVFSSIFDKESLFDNGSYLPSYHYGIVDLVQLACMHIIVYCSNGDKKWNYVGVMLGTYLSAATYTPRFLYRICSIIVASHCVAMAYLAYQNDEISFIDNAVNLFHAYGTLYLEYPPYHPFSLWFSYFNHLIIAPYGSLALCHKNELGADSFYYFSMLSGLLYPLQAITNYSGEDSLFSSHYNLKLNFFDKASDPNIVVVVHFSQSEDEQDDEDSTADSVEDSKDKKIVKKKKHSEKKVSEKDVSLAGNQTGSPASSSSGSVLSSSHGQLSQDDASAEEELSVKAGSAATSLFSTALLMLLPLTFLC